jgi:hypothetical protein
VAGTFPQGGEALAHEERGPAPYDGHPLTRLRKSVTSGSGICETCGPRPGRRLVSNLC